jgi:hypothetical protein
VSFEIEVEPMRSCGGNGQRARNPMRLARCNDDDLSRFRDVDVERFSIGVVEGPASPPGYRDVCEDCAIIQPDDGERGRTRNCRIADIRDENEPRSGS